MDYFPLYADFIKKGFSLDKKLKIVADCSNGTTGLVLKELKDIPNLELIVINDTPDPEFSAHGPNPLIAGATNQLAAEVIKQQADFGVAFDADGDRAFFVDEKGELMPSYMICVLLFKHRKPPYVADEWVYKSLQSLKLFTDQELLRSKVGTFYVKSKLRAQGASTAGEFSGHYYFDDFFKNDSGIFTMVTIANTVSKIPEKLSEFLRSLPAHYTKNDDLKLGDKKWADIEPKVHELAKAYNATVETLEGITLDMGDIWVNMRPSNTEPIVRMIGGGKNLESITEFIGKLKALV
jgi:phosphomannomutase